MSDYEASSVKQILKEVIDEMNQISFRVDSLQNALAQRQQETIDELKVKKLMEEVEELRKASLWYHNRLQELEKPDPVGKRLDNLEKEVKNLKQQLEEMDDL